MKEFRLVVELENAAFHNDSDPTWHMLDAAGRDELARILHKVADRVANGEAGFQTENVRDVNGNTVGSYAVKTRAQWLDGFKAMIRAHKD